VGGASDFVPHGITHRRRQWLVAAVRAPAMCAERAERESAMFRT
jgi:hypothetical protein